MFEITRFCTERKERLSVPLQSNYSVNEQLKMHKGEDQECEAPSVMMRHLNIMKYFSLESNLLGPELFMFSWDFIDCDN